MKIALTVDSENEDAFLDSRFGRAKFIVLHDIKNNSYDFIKNNVNLNSVQGAGIQTAQTIVDLNADVLITVNCGPKAFKVLNAGDVKIFQSELSSMLNVIKSYSDNKLIELIKSNVEGHWE